MPPDRAPVDPLDGVGELVMPEQLVTGEAVALDLQPASFATRSLAYLFDSLVQSVLIVALMLLASVATDDAAFAAMILTTTVAVFVLIPTAWEALSRGSSPGKAIAGLRVVRDDGGPIRWRQALVRRLVAVPEIYMVGGSAALITSLAHPRGKRLGDLLAGTFVIRERVAPIRPLTPGMPPELAAWAVTADLGRLPGPLVTATRTLLAGAGGLHPTSRVRLAQQLAADVARHVAPTPPGPLDPERFLAAVLAERHRRSFVRLTAEHQRQLARQHRRAAASVLSPTSTRLVGEARQSPGR